ncbi:MAG: hypothetical protein LBK99_09480, partial [Opitutaceae bacterium]|nr:hypothetical protein [Opitutaceae bacterium]
MKTRIRESFLAAFLAILGAGPGLVPALSAAEKFSWKLPGLEQETRGAWTLKNLTSPKDANEIFEEIDAPSKIGISARITQEKKAGNAVIVRVLLRNDGKQTRFLKSAFSVASPMQGFLWWNGYANTIKTRFDPSDANLSAWFPANALIGREAGFSLGLDPREVFSRVDTGRGTDGTTLLLDIPVVLNAGEQRTTSFVVTSFPARYGYRDVIQNYYDLFPEAYRPVENMHPSILSTESTYLFWTPKPYGIEHTDDMIRRLTGGRGGWEWCYAPFLRGGDWATTYEWTEGFKKYTRRHIDERRDLIRERMGRGAPLGVAPMYYVNVAWAEKTLIEKNFPETQNDPRIRRSWGTDAIFGLYTGANRYGDLFAESVKRIAEWYPQSRGIAWDSAFGHARAGEDVAGVLQTEARSFDKGRQFALTGVGFAPLLDLNRSLESEGWRRANAVNLKLVSPWFLGARSDSALYEGTPVEDSRRLPRFEVMRANLGSPKALAWHKNLLPAHIKWVQWDDLDAPQVRDAWRQLHQDALFLSYFWGGIPSPGSPTLGVPFVFEQVPVLIDLIRKGWQPSPAFEADGVGTGDMAGGVAGGGAGGEFLTARYGGREQGATLAIINTAFSEKNARLYFPIKYWNGKNLLLTRRDNHPLVSKITAAATLAEAVVPARSVLLLDVAGVFESTLHDKKLPDVLTATPVTSADGRAGWEFSVETYVIRNWTVELHADPTCASTAVRIGRNTRDFAAGQKIGFSIDSAAWPDDVQELNRRSGKFTVMRAPRVSTHGVSTESLQKLPWFAASAMTGGGGTTVSFEEVGKASAASIEAALKRWFLMYSANVLKKEETPVFGKPATPGGLPLVFSVGCADATDTTDAAAGSVATIGIKDGSARVRAATEQDLPEALDVFLQLMDKAFPYYGHIFSRDETVEFAGLSGKELGREMESDFILTPTLSQRLRQHLEPFRKTDT